MNITGENPLLFKCGKKGYMNQTYPPLTIYECGINEGKLTVKDKNEFYSILYENIVTYAPEGMVVKCGSMGFLNETNPWPRDYYACGLYEGQDTLSLIHI